MGPVAVAKPCSVCGKKTVRAINEVPFCLTHLPPKEEK